MNPLIVSSIVTATSITAGFIIGRYARALWVHRPQLHLGSKAKAVWSHRPRITITRGHHD